MALLTKSELRSKVSQVSGFQADINIRSFAANALLNEKRAADRFTASYDIFLSHSSEDAIYIKALRDYLTEARYSVCVDWIDDPQMDRSNVTYATASALRERMNSCKTLLYATSKSARNSVWMPWELGYMDAKTSSRVAIAPIVDDDKSNIGYKGQEYLGIYPYLDKTSGNWWIHKSSNEWVNFSHWLNGSNPVRHA